MRVIPYARQSISTADIEAVTKVLCSDYLTQGPVIPEFEKAVAAMCDVKYAVAVNSATSALHIACIALGLRSGDWLWTTPNTYVASANSAIYCGAQVDFVDIDPETYNLCPHKLEQKLRSAEQDGLLPKVVMPVHFSGQPCDMERISSLSQRYNFKIIEDASHALGARYKNETTGHCGYSDVTVFSFHPVKMITTGEGGMALTNDKCLAERMSRLRSHGVTRNEEHMAQTNGGPWYYEQIDLGFNYRMSDLSGALGQAQLARLDQFIVRRRQIVATYNRELANLPVMLPVQREYAESSWHLYVLRVDEAVSRISRNVLFMRLRDQGIGVNVHYLPVHTQPYYRQKGFRDGYCPNAERYSAQTITLPLFFDLTDEDQAKVIKALRFAICDR